MTRTLVLVAALVLAGCGTDERGSEPYVFPPATLEWSAPSYDMRAGEPTASITLRLWWDVDPVASGVDLTWVRVEALNWQSGGAPYPYLLFQSYAPPCVPCTKTFVLERRATAGAWTYRATFDPYDNYDRPTRADAVLTVE
jgi:hypothetical protein